MNGIVDFPGLISSDIFASSGDVWRLNSWFPQESIFSLANIIWLLFDENGESPITLGTSKQASERDALLLKRPPQSLPNDNSKYPDFLKK